MADIVTRLRCPAELCICVDAVLANCVPCNARLDAADEIERLRKSCSEVQDWIDHKRNCDYYMGRKKLCSCGYDKIWSKLESL